MSGWYSIHRNWQAHPVFGHDEFSRRDAWIWMIEQACWKPTRFNSNGKIVTLEKGQFGTSIRQMAEAWSWSKSSVDRFLTRLKTETMIETENGTGRLIITICNYEKYQDHSEEDGTLNGTQSGTRAGHERDTKEQINNNSVSKDTSLEGKARERESELDLGKPPEAKVKPKAKPKPEKKPTRLADDWKPGELPPTVSALTELWPPGRVDRELEAFRDYWASRSKNAAKLDWDKTWHNRIRDQHDRIIRENRNGITRQNGPQYKPSAALALFNESLSGDESSGGEDWPALPAAVGH